MNQGKRACRRGQGPRLRARQQKNPARVKITCCIKGGGVLFRSPTQQRTCLWPSVVTQRRQAFWQSFGRWFVRPFRQLRPSPSQVGVIEGGPGAMTPKIA